MGRIRSSLRHNLSRLSDFSGRDSRELFWPWAIILFLVEQAVSLMLTMVPLYRVFTQALPALAEASRSPAPEAATDAAMQQMMATIFASLGALWIPSVILHLAIVALLAAAVVRRLHDVGRKGWWGLLPLPFLAGSLAATPVVMNMFMSGRPPTGAEMLVFLPGCLLWIVVIALVVLLAKPGQEGPNRFGAASRPAS